MEARTTRASRFKYTIIGVLILLLAGFISSVLPRGRSVSGTSATLTVLGYGTNQYGTFVHVQLSNAGPSIITYRGNAPNRPRINVLLGFSGAILPIRGFPPGLNERRFELKPCRSIDFEVPVAAGHVCQVTLSYSVRDPYEWLRKYSPYQISRWLPRPPQIQPATSPFTKTDSQLAAFN